MCSIVGTIYLLNNNNKKRPRNLGNHFLSHLAESLREKGFLRELAINKRYYNEGETTNYFSLRKTETKLRAYRVWFKSSLKI